MTRSCLHCALLRALERDARGLAARGLKVHLGPTAPCWVPASGIGLYRKVRELLRDVQRAAEPGVIRISVVELTGKSHIEVLATIRAGGRTRVLRRSFPLHAPHLLFGGFAEALSEV